MSKKRISIRTQPSTAKDAAESAPAVAAEDAFSDQVPEPGAGPEQAGGRESESSTAAAPEVGLAQVRGELEAAKDRALRCQAELENYRRRVAREMELERRYAALPLLRDLLPVWDNVHRAIEAGQQSGDDPVLLKGFQMVAEQLEDTLRRHDCLRIEALWQPFDPNLHEAIVQQPNEEHPPGTVVGETQTGFRLHDRVVRPSQVIVSSAMSSDDG